MRHAPITLGTRTLVTGAFLAALIGAGTHSLIATGPPARPRVPATETSTTDQSRHGPSARSALAAAVGYVGAGQRIFDLAGEQRATALRAMAAAATADSYAAEQAGQLAELDGIAQRGQGPLTWHVAVLATRLDAITRHRARVEIWRLGTLSIAGLSAPIGEFTTVAYELVWERGAWRIWSETQTPGPSPMAHPEATPSTPTQWRARLEGFVRYPSGEAL